MPLHTFWASFLPQSRLTDLAGPWAPPRGGIHVHISGTGGLDTLSLHGTRRVASGGGGRWQVSVKDEKVGFVK